MPFSIEWGNEEKTISHLKVIGEWDWNDFYAATKIGYQMTDSVQHKVNVIVDFSESKGNIPPNALTHLRNANKNAHPRRGVVVIVSKRMMLVKTFANIIEKVARTRTTALFADTPEEAYSIIDHIINDKPDTIHLR